MSENHEREYGRRMSDKGNDIEALIADESDPKQRALLIVLHSINRALVANAETVREVADKLDTHLTEYETRVSAETALYNKGQGAWKVIAWVLGIVQAGVIATGGYVVNQVNFIHDSFVELKLTDARHDERIKILERK